MIQVPIIDDTLVENVEEFTVDLVSQENPSVVTVSPNMAVIRITDNDSEHVVTCMCRKSGKDCSTQSLVT